MRAFLFAGLLAVTGCLTAQAEDAAPYDPYADMVVSDDIAALPKPVQEKRAALIAATKSGDISKLKAILDAQKAPPRVSFGDPEDAIAYLKTESADGNGVQMLAVLGELLDAPYAVIGASSETPSYVWPYLAVADVTKLSPAEWVDAYRILPPEQAKGLVEMEGWYYWRVFIDPDGELSAFVAGD